ncbi:MAG: hypothetical protein SangKO_062430 [Sandaracinaceae bacterium]
MTTKRLNLTERATICLPFDQRVSPARAPLKYNKLTAGILAGLTAEFNLHSAEHSG